jgi:hypothetical protein
MNGDTKMEWIKKFENCGEVYVYVKGNPFNTHVINPKIGTSGVTAEGFLVLVGNWGIKVFNKNDWDSVKAE